MSCLFSNESEGKLSERKFWKGNFIKRNVLKEFFGEISSKEMERQWKCLNFYYCLP